MGHRWPKTETSRNAKGEGVNQRTPHIDNPFVCCLELEKCDVMNRNQILAVGACSPHPDGVDIVNVVSYGKFGNAGH